MKSEPPKAGICAVKVKRLSEQRKWYLYKEVRPLSTSPYNWGKMYEKTAYTGTYKGERATGNTYSAQKSKKGSIEKTRTTKKTLVKNYVFSNFLCRGEVPTVRHCEQ